MVSLWKNEQGQFVYGIVYDPNYEGEEVIFAPLDASLFTEGYAQGRYFLDYDTFTIIPCSGHKEHDLISAKEQAIAELVAGAEALNNVPAALAVLEYYTNTINQVTFIPQIEMLKTEALETFEAAQEAAISDKAKDVSAYDIFNAATLEEVAAAKTAALNAIAAAEKELADAKASAVAEVIATAGTDASDAVNALVENAIESINDKHNTEEVNNVKDKAVEAIKVQKEAEQPEHEDPSKTCKHMCHKSGFMGFIWKIVRFFSKLFRTNKVCSCGAAHY